MLQYSRDSQGYQGHNKENSGFYKILGIQKNYRFAEYDYIEKSRKWVYSTRFKEFTLPLCWLKWFYRKKTTKTVASARFQEFTRTVMLVNIKSIKNIKNSGFYKIQGYLKNRRVGYYDCTEQPNNRTNKNGGFYKTRRIHEDHGVCNMILQKKNKKNGGFQGIHKHSRVGKYGSTEKNQEKTQEKQWIPQDSRN